MSTRRHLQFFLTLGALSAVIGAACATPIEIPGAEGGAPARDAGWTPAFSDGAAAGFPDGAEVVPPDAFAFGDGFDHLNAVDNPLPAESGELTAVSALYADSQGLYVAAGTQLWHWAPGAPALALHSTAPASVHQIAALDGNAPRLYCVTALGVSSIPRAGGGLADWRTHYTPAGGGSFSGGVAVGASDVFVVDQAARQVLRVPLGSPSGALPQVLYSSPFTQSTTLSAALALQGEQLYFADYDGPMVVGTAGLAPAALLGNRRTSYRWSGVVPTAGALLVAQAGDFAEGLMRIALPGGGEEIVVWIGGANNNSGVQGPLRFGDAIVWSAVHGIYRTELATRATVRLARVAGPIAGDGVQRLYWSAQQRIYRATLTNAP